MTGLTVVSRSLRLVILHLQAIQLVQHLLLLKLIPGKILPLARLNQVLLPPQLLCLGLARRIKQVMS